MRESMSSLAQIGPLSPKAATDSDAPSARSAFNGFSFYFQVGLDVLVFPRLLQQVVGAPAQAYHALMVVSITTEVQINVFARQTIITIYMSLLKLAVKRQQQQQHNAAWLADKSATQLRWLGATQVSSQSSRYNVLGASCRFSHLAVLRLTTPAAEYMQFMPQQTLSGLLTSNSKGTYSFYVVIDSICIRFTTVHAVCTSRC
jgi:hypothetical protein